jgi:hypothetical protein
MVIEWPKEMEKSAGRKAKVVALCGSKMNDYDNRRIKETKSMA